MRSRSVEGVVFGNAEQVVEKHLVAAAVTANALLDRNVVRVAEHGINGDLLTGNHALAGGCATAVDVNRLNDLKLNSTLGTGHANAEALPGRISVQRVGQLCAGVVLNEHVHSVLDADVVTENALVTDISVVLLRIEVKALEILVALHNESEGIAVHQMLLTVHSGIELGHAALLCVLSAVELQITESEYALGSSAEPEVHKVKVVSRLVHEKTAGDLLISVPAAEVVSTVRGIQEPLEVNLSNLTDGVVHNELAELGVVRSVTVVEGNAQLLAGALDAVEDRLALISVHGHGLLGDNVTAHLHSLDYVSVVGTVDGGNDNDIGLGLLDHALKVLCFIGRNLVIAKLLLQHLVGIIHTGLVHVAECDELRGFIEVLCNGGIVHSRSATDTDVRVSFLFHFSPSFSAFCGI